MIYKNYLIVLELLLKSVKTIYALLRAQAPPLRCVSQYGSRLPLNLLNDRQPISLILMSWRLPKKVCRNRFFSTPLQINYWDYWGKFFFDLRTIYNCYQQYK